MENTIEINGEQYAPREHKSPKVPKMVSNFLMMSMMMAGGLPGFDSGKGTRPSVDIVEEYKLILQKKSRLSASDRAWVKNQFEYKYKKIEAVKILCKECGVNEVKKEGYVCNQCEFDREQ